MPGNSRDMITVAERRFPVRIRVGIPPGGFGQRHSQMTAWLDENCGAEGWEMTPSGTRGVQRKNPPRNGRCPPVGCWS